MWSPTYFIFVRKPWAKNSEFEDQHQELMTRIGSSIKELGYLGYILLYGITLYRVDERTLASWNIPDRDKNTIRQATGSLEVLYSRYAKQKIGWKKASFNHINQTYILQQTENAMKIFTQENLDIADALSNTHKLDGNKIAENRF